MRLADHANPHFNAPDFKKFDDGTVEFIPERPTETVNFNDYLSDQVKILNGGDNIMEFIKKLPTKAEAKLHLFTFIEKRQA